MTKQNSTKPITPKVFFIVLGRMLMAYCFYPVMIGLFLWGLYKGYHWIYGAAIIAAIVLFDPIWRVLLRRVIEIIRR